MIKVKNKSNSKLTLSFNRKDNSVFQATLEPKQFIFLENSNMTKSLIIQKRKENISIDEDERELPEHMEIEKVYSIVPTDPDLITAMSNAGKESIGKALEKELDNSTSVIAPTKNKGGRPKGATNKKKKKKSPSIEVKTSEDSNDKSLEENINSDNA